jgi:AcrR family transcriptional regulator
MVAMSVDDIKGRYNRRMARWEPGTAGRLQEAALALFIEAGFNDVTVADIATEADVSERTFFRHFATKEEVLFGESDMLLGEIIAAIRQAPATATPADLVGAAMSRLTQLFQPERSKHRQRSAVIDAEPALRERDLLKQSVWVTAIVAELVHRNIEPVRAAALAGAATAGFRAAYRDWLMSRSRKTLAERVDEVLGQLAQDLTHTSA